MGAINVLSNIPTYNLNDLTLEDIHRVIEKDEVFDIDKSLFSEDPSDPITNHFFDTRDETSPIL